MLTRILMRMKVSLILLLAIGCTTPNLAKPPAPTAAVPSATLPTILTSTSPAPSTSHIDPQILTLGDYQYVMECSGEGRPVVLFLGGRAAAWKPIQAEINRFTRTCVFEHMGSSPTPLTAAELAKNVHTLLKEAEIPAPHVLVGFSVGGYITRLYANLYPDEVAGIVLLDSSHEDQNARFLAALPPETSGECQELKDYRVELQGPHMLPVAPQISLDFDASATEVRAVEQNLGQLPLVVLTAGRSEWPDCFPSEVQKQLDQAWLNMQEELASLSTNSTQLVAAESGHNFAEQPEMVLDAIQQVWEAVPTGVTSSVLVTPSPTWPAKSTLSPVETIWETNGNPNAFHLPTELALDAQGNIYVIDGSNHRVQKFDKDGNFILMWGSQGAGEGQFLFNVPPAHYGSIAVDQDGYVYVTDHHNRVQKFDSNGTFLMGFGETGYADGEFATLYGIAVDAQGNIYTTDWTKYEVQKFDREGNFLQKWEVPSCNPGGISFPHNLVVDGQGQIYIPNADGNCIQKFDNEGNLLQQWGEMGEADGQLRKPIGLALDQQGNIYISENRNGRIQKFDSNGKFLAVYGPFENPNGIAVDHEGYVYMVEVVLARLQKLKLP